MNKFALISVLLAAFVASEAAQKTCKSSSIFIPVKPNVNTTAEMELTDMTSACVEQTRKQITMEIGASFQYLALGVHFSQDHINLPGFAKFFFDAASEEREHAYKLIEYLSMRGSYMKAIKAYEKNDINHNDAIYVEDIFKTISENPVPETTDGAEALKLALKKEKEVTNSIRTLIQVCEKEEEGSMNHYHFVDYLTGEFLEEQYKGQRDIAGKLSTLDKMLRMNNGKKIAEFLFDKQL